MHITWQKGRTVPKALTMALLACLYPVNRETSRVEGCTNTGLPQRERGPHLAEWMSSTRDLCQLFHLVISLSMVSSTGSLRIHYYREEIITMAQPSSLNVPGDKVASFL